MKGQMEAKSDGDTGRPNVLGHPAVLAARLSTYNV